MSTMNSILVIDDDVEIGLLLSRFLIKNGYAVEVAHRGNPGVELASQKPFDIVFSDFRLGDLDGRQVLQKIKEVKPSLPVVIITAYSDIKMAVDIMKAGAFDYVTKPLIPEEILTIVKKALDRNPEEILPRMEPVTQEELTKPAERSTSQEFLKCSSPESRTLYRQIELVAPTNYSVILYGESGTGKEVVARNIHDLSERRDFPFIAMDCGTLTRELAGSELFGHEKGSFTGAINSKEGHFELANGGTLFLDEVGNLPYDVQATLLRVLQERKIRRVGGTKELEVDVRLVVASNENLQDAYRKGKFREDLYHRFNEFSIDLAPLRMRQKDIMAFADFFLRKANEELKKSIEGFDPEVQELFLQYAWPGNLRELKNMVRRAVLLTERGLIHLRVLPLEMSMKNKALPGKESLHGEAQAGPANSLKSAAREAEYEKIIQTLKQVNYNRTKAARILNIDRKTLYNKLREFDLLRD